jgi:hypothetical protein
MIFAAATEQSWGASASVAEAASSAEERKNFEPVMRTGHQLDTLATRSANLLKSWRSLGDTKDASRNLDKTGTFALACFASDTTERYYRQAGERETEASVRGRIVAEQRCGSPRGLSRPTSPDRWPFDGRSCPQSEYASVAGLPGMCGHTPQAKLGGLAVAGPGKPSAQHTPGQPPTSGAAGPQAIANR